MQNSITFRKSGDAFQITKEDKSLLINYYSGSIYPKLRAEITTGSATFSGSIYLPNLDTSSNANSVVLYDSASGQLFYTASSGLGGSGTPAPSDTYIQYNQTGSFGGDSSFAYIYESHSLQQGIDVQSIGQYSHAQGTTNYAIGFGSHTEGSNTFAASDHSHTEGFYSITGYRTTFIIDTYTSATTVAGASSEVIFPSFGLQPLSDFTQYYPPSANVISITDDLSNIVFIDTVVSSSYDNINNRTIVYLTNTPIGSYVAYLINKGLGQGSHAEGYYTNTSGELSHAEGGLTIAAGQGSHAEGYGTIAAADYQHTSGQYNTPNTSSLFIIGNGNVSIRSNLALFNSESIILSKSIYLPDLTNSSEITNVVLFDSASGQLYYTSSNSIGYSLSGGTNNYLALWSGSTELTTSSLYQTGGFIGINTTNPTTTFEVSGSAQISNHLKLGTAPFPTWATSTGSRFDSIDYRTNVTINDLAVGGMARWAKSIYGSSSVTDFSPYLNQVVQFGNNIELAPGQTYNIAAASWNSRKIGVGIGLGIGVSGSVGATTTYNGGRTLNTMNYGLLGIFDAWPEFDQGTIVKNYNGQYAVYGGVMDIWGGLGSTMETLMFHTAGGFKSLVDTNVTNVIGYYSTLETEAYSSASIDNIYGYYSAPLYRSYATQSYGFYQSGSNDINYFEGRVGIGSGSITPSGSLYVSGGIYFPSLETSSAANSVVLYDSASGQLYYTSSNSIGGGASVIGGEANYLPLWSSATTLTTSSIYQTGSNTIVNTDNIQLTNEVFTNALTDFYGTETNWIGYQESLPSYLGTTILSSTISSITFANIDLLGNGYDLVSTPFYFVDAQITDGINTIQLDTYFPGLFPIIFNSSSFDGVNTTIYYQTPLAESYGINVFSHGNFIVSSSLYLPNVTTPTASIGNLLAFDSASGQVYYEDVLHGSDKYIPLWNGSTYLSSSVLYQNNNKIGVGTITPQATLDVSGSTIITKENTTALTVVGSGSATPVFVVYGSQGELFSVTDSLSGSLFSVHDISGLPVIESFSDATTLIGNYEAPALYTSVKKLITTGSGQIIYQLPTASYDGAFFDYTVSSGSNARSGQVIARHLSGSVNLAEIATPDFGNTTGFDLGVIITGSYMALTGSATTTGWNIKTIIRSI